MSRRRNEQDDLTFLLNFKEQTATLTGCHSTINDINIPRSIRDRNKEFIITSIDHHSFRKISIRSIRFPPDSQIEEIGYFAFFGTLIARVTIPPSVKIIHEHAFSECPNLIEIIITQDSELETIEEAAFSFAQIKEIFIPKHVKKIDSGAFARCERLKTIQFDPNSELQEINDQAFCLTRIKSITIPSTVSKLHPGWCEDANCLEKVTIQPNSLYYKNYEENDKIILGKKDEKSDIFDVLVFASRNIEQVIIPPQVTEIAPYAFDSSKIKELFIPKEMTKICKYAFIKCFGLEKVEFEPGSKLEIIEQSAFVFTNVKEISIPSSLKKIDRSVFSSSGIKKIEIPNDSKLESIGYGSFFDSQIESLVIPSHVSKLVCFSSMKKLNDLKIVENNPYYKNYEKDKRIVIGKSDLNSDVYDVFVFVNRNIEHVIIPSFIKIIQGCAIEQTLIESIVIPPQVTIIENCAFCSCPNLKRVVTSSDSQLKEIGDKAFGWARITSFYMPPLVENSSGAFLFCKNIQIIAFDDDSAFKSIYLYAVKNDNPNCIIMLPTRLGKLVKK